MIGERWKLYRTHNMFHKDTMTVGKLNFFKLGLSKEGAAYNVWVFLSITEKFGQERESGIQS